MFRSMSVLCAGVVALAIAGNGKADDDLIRLDGKGDADIYETRGGGGHGGGGGFHAGGGGFHAGGFGGGGFRGGSVAWGGGGGRGWNGGWAGGWNRGWNGGWNRGWNGGWGRGWYGGGFYRPYYAGFYGLGLGLGYGYGNYYGGYGGYYNSPSYYSQPYYGYPQAPCTCAAPDPGTNLTLSPPYGAQRSFDGTYPYDGGPRDGGQVPLPAGMSYRPALSLDGKLVSAPASGSYQFAAFGEQPSQPAQRAATESLRISYPAFGEPMPNFSGFSGGSTVYTVSLR